MEGRKVTFTDAEEFVIRTIKTTPREHYDGKWKPGRLYPLYSVVEDNGTFFVSQSGKMKEEPYVMYLEDTKEFVANEGWKIKFMSADSRISAVGGNGGGVTEEEVAEMISVKVDKVDGKGLSTNDYDDTEKSKVASAYRKPGGGIPKTDMASSVQTSLGKADSAYQKPSTGIPFTDLAGGVQDSLSNADSAYQKPAGGIPVSDLASGVIPAISTDISADATSDTKTVSPKAVKTYVDAHGGSGDDPEAVKYTAQSLNNSQKTQARTNIGAGTSDFSGSYDDLSNKPEIPIVPTISTNISTDAASDAKTASPKAVKTYVDDASSEIYNRIADITSDLSDTNDDVADLAISIETIGSGAFVVAWSGESTPVVADIPAGVSVTYGGDTYTGSLAAGASTVGKIYLVATGTSGNYDRYVTVGDSTYSWMHIGTTSVALEEYATKSKVYQLEAEVNGIFSEANEDFAITDEQSKAIVMFENGHIRTKNFDSERIFLNVNDYDYAVADESGNVIVACKNGHILTRNFNSEEINVSNYVLDKFQGKKIAIIGDSISTYSGYLPSDTPGYDGTTYVTYYPSGNVNSVGKTWWRLAAGILGILPENINNCSWSGSRVTGDSTSTTTAYAACSNRRISDLQIRGFVPDIVLVFISCNDWGNEIAVGNWSVDSTLPAEGTISTMREAYAVMLNKIHVAYPAARIFCMTNLDDNKRDEAAGYPTSNGNGVTTYAWNKNIVEIATAFGCDVIYTGNCGLNYSNMATYAVDTGLHPNAAGMRMIAQKVAADLIAKY